MEFFEWISIPQFFMQFFGPTAFETKEALIRYYFSVQTISLYVAAGIYLLCLILGGLGMMTMAKKVGMKNSWMGFIPFLNTYYAGKLAGETRVFGQKMKRVGLYTMIAEIVYVAVNVFMLVLWFAMTNPAYFEEVQVSEDMKGLEFNVDLVPLSLRWMRTAQLVCNILGYATYFALVFFLCVLFFAFFRKYYARSPFLMTFLCAVLPLRGFVIFAVRNNSPVDYNAWMNQRMQEYARRQQQMYGQGGYGQGGYGQNGYGGQPNTPPPADPFPDFDDGSSRGGSSGTSGNAGGSSGSSDEDPFPDF